MGIPRGIRQIFIFVMALKTLSNSPGVAVISCLKPLVLGTNVEKITVYKTYHNSLFSMFYLFVFS